MYHWQYTKIQLKTNAFVGNIIDNCHGTFNELIWLVLS